MILSAFSTRCTAHVQVSEENDDPIIVEEAYRGEYCVVMDPLDGSSNIDCGVSIGTIFGIYRVQPGSSGTAEDVLRVGILNLNPLRHADIILQMFKFGMYKDEAYPSGIFWQMSKLGMHKDEAYPFTPITHLSANVQVWHAQK